MSSASCDLNSRAGLRPQRLIRALIGAGCLRVSLAFAPGIGRFEAGLAATAVQWMSCAGSLILLALLDREVQERVPGISSLSRQVSYVALAGSLLPTVASLLFDMRLEAAPALAAAVAGLDLTLFCAMLLEWFLKDVYMDGPLVCESMVMARLTALQEIVEHSVRGAWDRGSANR